MVFLSSPQSSTASLFNKQICFSFILGRSNLNPDTIKIPPPLPCLVYNGNLNDRYITSVSIVRLLTPNSHARFSRVSFRRLHNARRIAHRLSNAVMFSLYTFFCSLQPFTTATNRSSSMSKRNSLTMLSNTDMPMLRTCPFARQTISSLFSMSAISNCTSQSRRHPQNSGAFCPNIINYAPAKLFHVFHKF